jgi:hypothetical protein
VDLRDQVFLISLCGVFPDDELARPREDRAAFFSFEMALAVIFSPRALPS